MAAVIEPTLRYHESGITGAGPAIWYGNDAVDGDRADWLKAPIGSLYCKKSTTSAFWYQKVKADGADNDWSLMEGSIRETLALTDFTDGGSTAGTATLSTTLPVGAWVHRVLYKNVTGFAGDTSATIAIGDGTDVDRWGAASLPSVFATAAALDAGAVSGTPLVTTAVAPVITVTSGSDFGAVSAGSVTVCIFFYA